MQLSMTFRCVLLFSLLSFVFQHVSGACTSDLPPPGGYSCQQQKEWGKCGEDWMKDFCCITCTRNETIVCQNGPPPGQVLTCSEIKSKDLCSQSWVQNYCCQDCGRITPPTAPPPTPALTCTRDISPDPVYTCEQQQEWGKCNEPWMQGYCCISCPPPPPTQPPTNGSNGDTPSSAPSTSLSPSSPSSVAPSPVPSTVAPSSKCQKDVPPDPSYTCLQQKNWGKCYESWMKGSCCKSCPPLDTSRWNKTCQGITEDVSPSTAYTCPKIKELGLCDASYVKGYCCRSCSAEGYFNNCTTDDKPPGTTSCSDFRDQGRCGRGDGFCCRTCQSTCTDDAAPTSDFTCEDRVIFGQCNDPFMSGYCCITCGKIDPPSRSDLALISTFIGKVSKFTAEDTKNTFWGTDQNGAVTWINMVLQDFRRPIPAEFYFLTALQKVDLSSSSIWAGILPLISNLKNLTSLNLAANVLKANFPSEIGALLNMEELSLEYNNFRGTLPNLWNMKKLRRLSLGSNLILQGTIPTEIGLLTSLEYLGLFENQFTGTIPTEIGNLKNLTFLDISSNRLSGTIPSQLGQLLSLKTLSLASNQLSGSIPSEVSQLPNLETIDLSVLQLTGTLPTLSSMTVLKVISFSRNSISGTIPNLSNYTKLETVKLSSMKLSGTVPLMGRSAIREIDLSYNSLGGSIPPSVFSSSVEKISLQWNRLTGTIPNLALLGADSLKSLTLSSNQLSGPIPTEMGTVEGLQVLYLQNNSFSGTIPPHMRYCTPLIIFNVDDNLIDGVIPSFDFSWLQNLQVFHVANNKLSGTIPDFLRLQSKAKDIDMRGNQFELTTWAFLPCVKSDQYQLNFVQIDISNNNITSLPSSNDRNCPFNDNERIIINLSKNQISTPISVLQNVPNFYEIDLSSNLIGGQLSNRKELDPFLTRLILNNNKIVGNLPEQFLEQYPSLETFQLSQNQLVGKIPAQWVQGRIKVLDLSINNMEDNVANIQNVSDGLSLILTKNIFYGNLSTSLWAHPNKNLRIDFNLIDCAFMPLWCAGGTLFPNGTGQCYPCVSPCGDGLRFDTEQCDDGNLINGDGCSSRCTVEDNWSCIDGKTSTSSSLLLPSPSVCKQNTGSDDNTKLIIIVVIILVIFLLCVVLGTIIVMKILQQKNDFITQLTKKLGVQKSVLIDEADLLFENVIGQGAFGSVWKGLLGKTSIVAIKQMHLTSDAEKNLAESRKASNEANGFNPALTSFINEAKTIANLPPHPHIVQFLGLCISETKKCLFIVTQFVPSSNMQRYMQINKTRINFRDTLALIKGVAAGMDHLHKYNVIHNDLAARNILVEESVHYSENGDMQLQPVAKVADFGLASQTNLKPENQQIPVRWTAPEVLQSPSNMSPKSDVWSFGVVVYEVVNYCERVPYGAMDNATIVSKVVKEKFILPAPEDCPTNIYEIMQNCWAYSPEKRPTFEEIYGMINHIYQKQKDEFPLTSLSKLNTQSSLSDPYGVMIRSVGNGTYADTNDYLNVPPNHYNSHLYTTTSTTTKDTI